MITLPFKQTGRWSVAHAQNFIADIVDTFNMNFNRPSRAALGKKPVVLMTEDADSSFETVMAIVPISNGISTTYYFVTTSATFTWEATTTAFTKLTTTGMPTLDFDSDGVSFKGIPHVSGNSKVASYASSAWTDRITGLSTSYPHPLCVSEHQNYLAVGNGSQIPLYDTSYSLITTLTIPSEYVVTGIRWRNSNLYINTRNIAGNSAKLFVWNGTGTAAQAAWDAKAAWIYSSVDALSSIVIVTSTGQLLRFNGGGFDEVEAFPVYREGLSWETNSSLVNSSGRVANRGMAARGDRIFININGGINASALDTPNWIPNQPSGLWIYDKNVGLYHAAGYCATKYRTETLSIASSYVNFSTAHYLQTGDPVYITNVGGTTGITVNQLYFAIVESSTQVRLAVSRAASKAGTYVPITGSSTTATAIIDTYDMMGATYTQSFPGAVGTFVSDYPPAILGSEVMYCGEVTKSDGTTTISSCMSLGIGHARGSFTTTPIPSGEVTDNFQKIVLFLSNLWADNAKAVLKFRTVERYGFPTQIRSNESGLATWTAANSFTINAVYKNIVGIAEKDEVFIIEGAGAGYRAHIQSIVEPQTPGATTYTITLDEDIPQITAGQKSEVIVDNWQKLTDSVDNSIDKITEQFTKVTVGGTGSMGQFKIELQGFDIGLWKIQNISKVDEKAV